MDLNIKGIVYVNYSVFKNSEELIKFTRSKENFDILANVNIDDDVDLVLDYSSHFDVIEGVWILNNYLVAWKIRKTGKVTVNPDFTRFLLENSIDFINFRKVQEKNSFIEDLSVDKILDRISEIGIENITEEEKEFLKNNG